MTAQHDLLKDTRENVGLIALFWRHKGVDGTNPIPEMRLEKVRVEMALHVLACNLTRVMNVPGTSPLIDAMRA